MPDYSHHPLTNDALAQFEDYFDLLPSDTPHQKKVYRAAMDAVREGDLDACYHLTDHMVVRSKRRKDGVYTPTVRALLLEWRRNVEYFIFRDEVGLKVVAA